MWPAFYFGARNPPSPELSQDPNAFFGKTYTSGRGAPVRWIEKPMQGALDYVWAGSNAGAWDPLATYTGYPAAPHLSAEREAQYVRTVPMRNALGYQIQLLKDNGVPVGGTPATTPRYVKAGPIQIGYMSAIQPVAQVEQLARYANAPGPVPNPAPAPMATRRRVTRAMRRMAHNPAQAGVQWLMPSTLNIRQAQATEGYGLDGGGPYSWPGNQNVPGFQIVGFNFGWPIYGYRTGPPNNVVEEMGDRQRADANPRSNPVDPVLLAGAGGAALGGLLGYATHPKPAPPQRERDASAPPRLMLKGVRVTGAEKAPDDQIPQMAVMRAVKVNPEASMYHANPSHSGQVALEPASFRHRRAAMARREAAMPGYRQGVFGAQGTQLAAMRANPALGDVSHGMPPGKMSHKNAVEIGQYAQEVRGLVGPQTQLPGWVEHYLSRARRDVGDVGHYLQYQAQMQPSPAPNPMGLGMERTQQFAFPRRQIVPGEEAVQQTAFPGQRSDFPRGSMPHYQMNPGCGSQQNPMPGAEHSGYQSNVVNGPLDQPYAGVVGYRPMRNPGCGMMNPSNGEVRVAGAHPAGRQANPVAYNPKCGGTTPIICADGRCVSSVSACGAAYGLQQGGAAHGANRGAMAKGAGRPVFTKARWAGFKSHSRVNAAKMINPDACCGGCALGTGCAGAESNPGGCGGGCKGCGG